jgi:chromosome segregation ATPase
MGSGASRNKTPATSLAVKESRAKAAQLERELERLEAEKIELSKELSGRLSDIEKLGELNRTLEKNNQKLKTEIDATVSRQYDPGNRIFVIQKLISFHLCAERRGCKRR